MSDSHAEITSDATFVVTHVANSITYTITNADLTISYVLLCKGQPPSLLAPFVTRSSIASLTLSQAPWVINCGASSQMTCNMNLFTTLDIHVHYLPIATMDSSIALVFSISTVRISNHLIFVKCSLYFQIPHQFTLSLCLFI